MFELVAWQYYTNPVVQTGAGVFHLTGAEGVIQASKLTDENGPPTPDLVNLETLFCSCFAAETTSVDDVVQVGFWSAACECACPAKACRMCKQSVCVSVRPSRKH